MLARLAWVALPLAFCLAGARADSYEDGLGRFNRGDFSGAIIELKNALGENPKNLSARLLLGQAYIAIKLGAAAEVALRQARVDGADAALVRPPLGKAYLLQQKYEVVLDDIAPLGQSKRVDAQIETLRGHAFLGLRELTSAEESFERAIRLSETPVKPLIGLAQVRLQRDKAQEARVLVKQALALAPNEA